ALRDRFFGNGHGDIPSKSRRTRTVVRRRRPGSRTPTRPVCFHGSVATPLQYGDPPRLGPFTIQARLQTMPAGFVYLGQAADGRVVSIAVLTRGAALDAAARDRFVGAIREAMPGGVRGRLARVWGRAAVAAPEVLACDLGRAPWVAVPYRPGGPGAERFLEPVY